VLLQMPSALLMDGQAQSLAPALTAEVSHLGAMPPQQQQQRLSM
jgi:hypothetical protein